MRERCFADKEDYCEILEEMVCKKKDCKFYKPVKLYQMEQKIFLHEQAIKQLKKDIEVYKRENSL